jgi:hypothetical protein
METNQSSQKNLPQDIRTAMQKHEAVLRLSYTELVSGISRLLRQGIPKEVIAQVVTQAVDAVSKEFSPLPIKTSTRGQKHRQMLKPCLRVCEKCGY